MRSIRTVVATLALCVSAGGAMPGGALAALPEFAGPFPKALTVENEATFLGSSKFRMICGRPGHVGLAPGKITAPKAGTMAIAMVECEYSGLPCENAGLREIVTSKLSVALQYRSRERKTVNLKASAAKGGVFATFTCGPIPVTITGSVTGQVTPVGEASTRFVVDFEKSKLEISINGGLPEPLEYSQFDDLRLSESTEINA
jgi:hypothetical protein